MDDQSDGGSGGPGARPDVYGAVFCGSPGGGYKPPDEMPSSLPRVYLFAGTLEPFFLDNATRGRSRCATQVRTS